MRSMDTKIERERSCKVGMMKKGESTNTFAAVIGRWKGDANGEKLNRDTNNCTKGQTEGA